MHMRAGQREYPRRILSCFESPKSKEGREGGEGSSNKLHNLIDSTRPRVHVQPPIDASLTMINGPVDKESARHLTIRGNKASEESFKLKHLTEWKDIKRLTHLHHERVDSSDSESDPHPDSDEPKSGSHESPLPLPASVSAEASKRRKRLASSCLTCRKRKVKCDLNYPMCVKCEKQGFVCRFINDPGKRGDHVKEADEPEERKHPKSQVDDDECWQYLLNTISTHMELAEENTWSDTDSASLRAGTETKWMGYPFKPPIPPFIKMNKNAGNDGTPTSPETAVKRQRVATFTVDVRKDVRKEELREYERRAKRVMEDQEKLARDTVLAASGACPICLQKKVPCHHHGMPWDVANKKCGNPREDSTAKELAPSTAGNHEQQSDTLYQEGTVADSGYVSAGASRSIHGSKLREELREDGTTAQQEAQDPLAVDQQTVYTSPILPHGSDYISDLCNDIHLKLKDDLQEQAHDQDRVELLNCLPDLIKALSIRIGFDISNPSRTYVMHFLHTHYRDIVAQLRALCRNREETPELGPRRTADQGMTVLDRMKLWSRKENEESPLEPMQDCFFEGVCDLEEEDIPGDAKMATYRDSVLSSTAYQWFIESLRKQLSLDWGSDEVAPANSCHLIHESIMSKMPSGIISRHRPPEIHHAKFRIKLRSDVFHCLERVLVANLITLTSSAPNTVQALTVQDYLHQTWSSGGLRLAELIQKACCGEYRTVHTDEFDDNTAVTAQFEMLENSTSAGLLVTASGPMYSVSQCGEQLAWLGAAIQRFRPSIASCTCSIESQHENEWLFLYSLDDSLPNTSPTGVQTAQRFCDATIIHGFPTKRRPSLFQGLELGLADLLDCIGAYWPPVLENGTTVLKGSLHTLELVKHTQNVSLWHALHSSSTSCSFLECPSLKEHDKLPSERQLQTEIWASNSRHIIANSEYLGVPVVDTECPIDNEMDQSCVKAEVPSIEMRQDFDSPLSPTENSSSAMESSGDSLDSDMLSISSEDSDCVTYLDREDPLTSIIDQISHRIFAEFKESKVLRSRPQWAHTGNGGPRDNPGSSGSTPKSCEISKFHGIEGPRSGKRGRLDGEDEDWDEGGFRRPPRPTKRPTRSPTRPRAKVLACPFWKFDSQAHRVCFKMKCSRISDVKQHLARKHKQPASEYCQRCWTAFESQTHKNEHLRDDTGQKCKYNPAARPVGIDNTMAAALHKKSKPVQCTEDQWFAIWEIVFPDQPRPSSPYIDDSLTEDATQLQEIVVNQWPSILASVLEEVGGLNTSIDTDRLERERLIRATLTRLSDDFSAEQALIRAVRSASDHESPGGQTSSSSNRADSAIETGSYPSRSYPSSGSGDDVSLSVSGTAIPQLETYPPARSENSVMYSGRGRHILPLVQNNFNVDYDGQETPVPHPTMSQRNTIPNLTNAQTTDIYGAGHSFGIDFTITGSVPLLTRDNWSQNFVENGDLDENISWQGMEYPTEFDWSTFDIARDSTQPQPGTPGAE